MAARTTDPRDRFPPDDVLQPIVALLGAVVGTVLGGVLALVTGSTALDDTNETHNAIASVLSLLWHCVVTVIASAAIGLIAAWAWDTVLKRATNLGSPMQDLREPGQQVTIALAGLVSVAGGLFLMLVAPWLAGWIVVLVLVASVVQPAYMAIKRAWDIVK